MLMLITLAPLASQAAVVTERYTNGTDITHLFLWSDDPGIMNFSSVDLTDVKLTGWVASATPGAYLVLEGPEVKKNNGKFDIDFNYSGATTFTFQFAEVLYDGVTVTIQDTGNVAYNGKKLLKPIANPLSAGQMIGITTHFAPVPIPSSVVLMMSAIGFMGFASRRITGAATVKGGC